MENAVKFCADLYRAVDNKDINFLSKVLAEDIDFRIANFPSVTGKKAVIIANQQFFGTIKSMHHTLLNTYSVADDIFCHGTVDYQRLDGSAHQAFFSTALKLKQGKIAEYLVFADLSKL
ncbi:MAG: nuclear transport factor 2 family protein [Oceanospirillaceae bacterium]